MSVANIFYFTPTPNLQNILGQSTITNYSEYIQGDTGPNPDTTLRVYGARRALYTTVFENAGYLPRTEPCFGVGFARVSPGVTLVNLVWGLRFANSLRPPKFLNRRKHYI